MSVTPETFGPVTASIEGIMPAVEFDQLLDALTALLKEVGQLRVWPLHRDFIELGLGRPEAAECIAGHLQRTGWWGQDLYVGDIGEAERHRIEIVPTRPAAPG
ncbi:hypothetical protein [Kitasatospora sp. GAS204B]|uniref:hypothetical protein n=1 Tax=unclassified Kitasatospora TaxID=2633591 RepID=UPI0024748754|nr:hypothetical protein [Kitasatospora sp. GAS204B]MDH6119317.1 hypothetical protein [Kitasatospora sp. GAS204B]